MVKRTFFLSFAIQLGSCLFCFWAGYELGHVKGELAGIEWARTCLQGKCK